MMFVTADDTPLIIVWNRLPDDEATVELMIEAFEVTPFTFEVKVLVAEDRVCEVITEVVPIDPPIFEVKTFPVTD
jgi:hypothetical protein